MCLSSGVRSGCIAKAVSCQRPSRRFAHGALAFACVLAAAPAAAMSVAQVHALPGGNLMERRVDRVLTAFGLPAVVEDATAPGADPAVVRWGHARMHLGPGAWTLVYGHAAPSPDPGTPGWRNRHARASAAPSRLVRLALVARGGVGVVTIDRPAHKTIYAVPKSPLRAHKVVAVTATFARPVSAREIVDRYGHRCEFTVGPDGAAVMRFWALRQQSGLPLALYTVDFTLGGGDRVTGYTIRGFDTPYVRRRLHAYYRQYLDKFSD